MNQRPGAVGIGSVPSPGMMMKQPLRFAKPIARVALSVALCAFPLCVSVAHGQSGVVLRGRVEGPSSQPIANAQVHLDGQSRITDSVGGFSAAVKPGRHRLVIQALGYTPSDTTITVADATTMVIIRLVRSALLPDVQVKGEGKPARYANTAKFDLFYERRARGAGVFFTREDIEASGKSDVVELLRGVAGVRIVRQPQHPDTKLLLRFARCSVKDLSAPQGFGMRQSDGSEQVALFVNGLRTSYRNAMEILDDFKTHEVEAVEIFRGPSQLPQEAMGDACAAIFIWTRYTVGNIRTPPS